MINASIRFQIAALFVWLIMLIDYKRNIHLKLLSGKFFKLLLVSTGINLLLDFATGFTITHMELVGEGINRLTHQLFIASIIISLYFYYMHIFVIAHRQKRHSRAGIIISLLPLAVSAVVILYGKLEYIVTSQYYYSRGFMAYTVYLSGILYLLASYAITCDESTDLNRNQIFSIRIGLFIWIVILFYQMLYKQVLLSALGLVLMVLSMYFTFENQREYLDSAVECFNRNAFSRMMNEYIYGGKDIILINIVCHNLDVIDNMRGTVGRTNALLRISKIARKIIGEEVFHSRDNCLSIFADSQSAVLIEQLKQAYDNVEYESIRLKINISIMDISGYELENENIYELIDFYSDSLENSPCGIYRLDENVINRMKRYHEVDRIVTRAVYNDGFEMFYQPIYDTINKKFHSAEALIRLKKIPDIGFISPEEFIPIIEKKGLISKVGNMTMEMVAKDSVNYGYEKLGIKYIEVNLSRIEAVSNGIADRIENIALKYGLSNSFFNLEITETAAIDSDDELEVNAGLLAKKGFTLSLDDFGTGYSNLSQMNKVNYDLVKLDKSIIWPAFDEKADKEDRDTALKLLRASIQIIKGMGKKIVAEGIETKEMVDYLTENGVDYLQGYYFSKPVNRMKFVDFLKKNNMEDNNA